MSQLGLLLWLLPARSDKLAPIVGSVIKRSDAAIIVTNIVNLAKFWLLDGMTDTKRGLHK